MFRRTLMLGIILTTVLLSAQVEPMPQTARQALIEMFSGRAGSFEKHLPEAMLTAIQKADPGSAGSMLSAMSLITGQMHTSGRFESFEAGPILFVSEDPQAHSKVEAIVERDDLNGETDEIEVSFRTYKDGQLQTAGIDMRFTVGMQSEKKIWRLHDMKFSVGVSLTDPNFLKLLNTPLKTGLANMDSTQAQGGTTATLGGTPVQSGAAASFGAMHANSEASAAAALRTINTAEATYAAAYPAHGFTCVLSDFGGMGGGGSADEHHAMLLEPRLSNGRKNGYIFKLSNCNGTPASTYSVTAVPGDPSAGSRAFCSDQSGAIRYSQDGRGESCLTAGQPLQ